MRNRKIIIFLLSMGAILTGIVIDLHFHETHSEAPYSVLVLIEIVKTVGATGLAVLALNLWIETDDWVAYFQQKIGSMLIEQRYMDGLSAEMLNIVILNVMRSKFKTNIESKGSFFEHFSDNFINFIGEPYRENVTATIEYTDNTAEDWLVVDQMTFVCKRVGQKIQPVLSWMADEADKPLTIEVVLFRNESLLDKITLEQGDSNTDDANGDNVFARLKRGVSLAAHQDCESFKIKITAKYIQSKSRYSAWSMSQPSLNIDITIIKPEDHEIIYDNLIVRDDKVDVINSPKFLRFSYKGWLLPENGFVWQLRRPSTTTTN